MATIKYFALFLIALFSLSFVFAYEQNKVINIGDSSENFPRAKLYYCNGCSNNTPVLLVHGWGNEASGEQGNWEYLESELENDGYNVWKIQYYPANMSNRKNAYLVSESISKIKEETGYTKINVVSHSMGGLATRGYIQNMAIGPDGSLRPYSNDIDKYVIIASPMYGTYFANLINGKGGINIPLEHPNCQVIINMGNLGGWSEATKDMEIGSDFIWELNNQNINKNVQYLTISGSETLDELLNISDFSYCLSNKFEINDGVVSLINSNLIKNDIPSILINQFHKRLPLADYGSGINYNLKSAGLISLFFNSTSQLNPNDIKNIIDENIGEKYITGMVSSWPEELKGNGSVIIQIKKSELDLSTTNISLKNRVSEKFYILKRNPNSGRWFFVNLEHKTNEYIDFTTLLPAGSYDPFINNKNSYKTLNIDQGQVNFAILDLDNDNDKFDLDKIGGSDCNDWNLNVNPNAKEICDNIDNDCDGKIDTNDENLQDGYEFTNDICEGSKLKYTFNYGNYTMPKGLSFNKDNLIIDCQDSTIKGDRNPLNVGISLTGNNITLINCKIENFNQAIFINSGDGASYSIYNNSIKNNNIGIVSLTDINNKVMIFNNDIFNNTNGNIHQLSNGYINATNNFWGTTNESEISSMIHQGSGEINWKPFSQQAFFEENRICEPNYQWTMWGECINGSRTRQKIDLNNCNQNYIPEVQTQECGFQCQPNWNCLSWSSCNNGQQARVCNDINQCGTEEGKPAEVQSCSFLCYEYWSCTEWSSCFNGKITRTCTELNSCGTYNNKPNEESSCSSDSSSSHSSSSSSSKKKSSQITSDSVIYTVSNENTGQNTNKIIDLVSPISNTNKITSKVVNDKSNKPNLLYFLIVPIIFIVLLTIIALLLSKKIKDNLK